MIEISKVKISGLGEAIRGMRNPMNSWDKSDTVYGTVYTLYDGTEIITEDGFSIGYNDLDLMHRLAEAGTDHRKFMRMIVVYLDINAPMYWWKEFDTYKVGTVRNSCSTMHKIHSKEFTLDDFSHEHLDEDCLYTFEKVISQLNTYREKYNKWKDKEFWWQMIQLLPSSYNQKSTVMLNYEVLANMYHSRNSHKLDEWVDFCKWIESLPYSELITS